jgi:hypothetical protein
VWGSAMLDCRCHLSKPVSFWRASGLPMMSPTPISEPGSEMDSISFYLWGNGGPETDCGLPKATQLISGQTWVETRVLWPSSMCT